MPAPSNTPSTNPSDSAAETSPPTPVPSPRAPVPPSRRKTTILIAVVVVVMIVVLAALALSGAFNSSSSGGSSSTATPVAYSTAIPLATTAAQSAAGGPWTIVAAEGIGVPSTVSQTNVTSIGGSGCTFTPAPGRTSDVSIPGTPSATTAGKLSVWVFFAKNSSQDVILLISVVNGDAAPLVSVSGCSTVSVFAGLDSIATANVVDSTTVASTFDANGGSTFLANGTWQIQLFILLGGATDTGGTPWWDLHYSTCAITATSGPGSEIMGVYDANSGADITPPQTTSTTCA
jgi:hypothetical protein